MAGLQLLLVLALLVGSSLQLTNGVGKKCPCQQSGAKNSMKNGLGYDTISHESVAKVSCCKDILLGYQDAEASIHWSFNGEAFSEEWASSLKPRYCGMETITTTSARFTDHGNYSCTITTSNGTSRTFSMQLDLRGKIEYRDKPTAMKVSGDVRAKVGARAVFSCESYVGINKTTGLTSLWWTYFFPNHSKSIFASRLPNVNITQIIGSGKSWGMLKGYLVIPSIQEEHFGSYQCTVKNRYASVRLNVSLIDDIPEAQAEILWHRTTVVVVASVLGVVMVVVVGWHRWRRLLLLYYRHPKVFSDGQQYDVFLVHGDSASRWVWSFLLPVLEDTLGYSCFLPQRDMCGGTMVAESVLEALDKCRRVVVVVTPCLLCSHWATWTTCSGIYTALTTRARIFALVHKEQSLVTSPSDQNPLLSVLKVVRKIKVPKGLVWPLHDEESSIKVCNISTQDNTKPTELNLIIPEVRVSTSAPNSPVRSQKVSNMIIGSNTSSMKDLECDKEETTQAGEPVVFTGENQQDAQDPGTPNSVTPFILPPYLPSTNASMWQSVGRCLKMMCIGNPEEQFWQNLRLHLGPPSLSPASSTEK